MAIAIFNTEISPPYRFLGSTEFSATRCIISIVRTILLVGRIKFFYDSVSNEYNFLGYPFIVVVIYLQNF